MKIDLSKQSAWSLVFLLALIAISRATDTSAPSTGERAATPLPRSENTYAFKVGDLDATALRDGVLLFPNDGKELGVGHTPEETAALLSKAGAPTDSLKLDIQPLLVRAGAHVLLFDAGAGTNLGGTVSHLLVSLAEAGVEPQSVTDIFVSHAHGDHVGGLVNDQGALVFPNATIHLSAPEWTFLNGMDAEKARSVAIQHYAVFIAAITPKVAAFTPGAELIPGLVKAVEIKGHTPGHAGYLVTSGQDSLLYVGDGLHHYVVSVQRPEWANNFDTDPTVFAASRQTLLEQSATSGYRVYGVHFPFPGIGRIEKRNQRFCWVPE